MNYQLISAVLKGIWAIDEDIADSYLPLIHSILSNGPIVSELTFNEKDYQAYAIERNTVGYNRWDGGFEKAPKNSIAVIPIHGPLMRSDQACGPVGMETIGERVKEANSNPNIKGIFFPTNTPGGTVDGLDELSQILESVTKPKLTFAKGVLASAGVYLASSSDKIIAASDRTIVGSVGTIMNYKDISGALEKLGIKDRVIRSSFSSNKNKYTAQIEAGEYAEFQKDVLDPLALDFINIVKKNLPEVREDQLTGDRYYAIDVLGTFVDAIGNYDFAVAELNTLIDEHEANSEDDNSNQNTYAMEKQYSNVNAVLGITSLESEEAGIYLSEAQIAALDAGFGEKITALETANQATATAEQSVTTAKEETTTAITAKETAETALATAEEANVKLVDQIENGGSASGLSQTEETIPGAENTVEKVLAELTHNKAAAEALEE